MEFRLLSFFTSFADHISSSSFNIFSTTNLPPSTPSNTGLKTRPKASRRVHIVSINFLASYSTWCRSLFALVNRVLEKAHQSFATLLKHFYFSQNIKLCPAQPYSTNCLGLRALGQTNDISSLGPTHTLTRGEAPLLDLPQNGRFAYLIPLGHKLTSQGSLQAETRPICCAASIHYGRL